jgi:uncharacterized glyoxalase superfamily protein PhnB
MRLRLLHRPDEARQRFRPCAHRRSGSEFGDTSTIDGESHRWRKQHGQDVERRDSQENCWTESNAPRTEEGGQEDCQEGGATEGQETGATPSEDPGRSGAAVGDAVSGGEQRPSRHGILQECFWRRRSLSQAGAGRYATAARTLNIRGSDVMLSDEFPEHDGNRGSNHVGSTTVTIDLWVPNADEAFAQVIAAGASVIMSLADTSWGDRYGKLRDPFGHEWSIAHHIRDASPAEIAEAAKNVFLS